MGKEKLDKSKLVCTRGQFPSEPLTDPQFVSATGVGLPPDEVVIGLEMYGVAKAYPTSMLGLHHCVNDLVYIKPVLISLCSLCSSGVGFDPMLGRDRRLTFELYGVYQGAMVMRDQQTGSLWTHVEGRCLRGPLSGRQLRPLPVIHATWAQWLGEHPDTLVLSANTPYRDRYRPLGQLKARLGSGYRRYPSQWRQGLPPEALVLGIRTEEGAWAYPLAALEPVVNDVLGKLLILSEN